VYCFLTKIDGILYDHDRISGAHYPDLESMNDFWNQVRVLATDYRFLVSSSCVYVLVYVYELLSCN